MNERLKADFKQLGIDVELVPIEWNNIISGNRAGFQSPDWASYDMIHISLSLTNPVAVRNFTTSGVPPAGCCNPSGYSIRRSMRRSQNPSGPSTKKSRRRFFVRSNQAR